MSKGLRWGGGFGRAAQLVALVIVLAVGATGCQGRTPDEKLQSAMDKLQVQNPPDVFGAMTILRGLLKDDKASEDIRIASAIQLARINNEMQDKEEALRVLSETMSSMKAGSEGERILADQLAMAHDVFGEPAKSVEILEKTLANSANMPVPQQTAMRLRLAAYMRSAGQHENSRKIYQEYLDTTAGDPQLQQMSLDGVVRSFLPDEPIKAADVYKAYADKFPTTDLGMMANYGAGVLYVQHGQKELGDELLAKYFAEADKKIDTSLELQAKFALIDQVATARRGLGQSDEEAKVLAKGKDAFPKNPEYYTYITMRIVPLLMTMNKREEALEWINDIQKKYPNTEQAARVPVILQSLERAEADYKADMAKRAAEADAATSGTTEPAVSPATNDAPTTSSEAPTAP